MRAVGRAGRAGVGRSGAGRRDRPQHRGDRLQRARRPARLQDVDRAVAGPLVSLCRPFLAPRLVDRRRDRSEGPQARQVRARAEQHLHRPDRHRRHHHDHRALAQAGRLGRRRQAAVQRGRADLGHQRSGQSEAGRPLPHRARRHPPQLLCRRPVHACRRRHEGLSRQYLCDRRHQRPRQAGRSRALVGAGSKGGRDAGPAARDQPARSARGRGQHRVSVLWRRRHGHRRHRRRGEPEICGTARLQPAVPAVHRHPHHPADSGKKSRRGQFRGDPGELQRGGQSRLGRRHRRPVTAAADFDLSDAAAACRVLPTRASARKAAASVRTTRTSCSTIHS